MTYKQFQAIKEHADYLIDLHDGAWGNFFSKNVIYHNCSGKLGQTQKELAIASGLDVIWCTTEALPFSGASMGAGTIIVPQQLGIPSIAFEVGGSTGRREGREWSINARLEAAQNVMKHLGMIEGKPKIPSERRMIMDAWWYSTNNAGIVTLKVELLEEVKKGQVLAEIRDIFDNELVDQIICPMDRALVTAIRDYPYTEPGGWVIFLGKPVDKLP
jgi:predicted deacylase